MEIYTLTFIFSTLLFLCYEKAKKSNIKKCILIVAVLLPCLLAGMRDVSIGADTSGYVSTLFNTAQQSKGIADYYNSTFYYEWHDEPVIKFDLAYTLLAYLCSSIFGTFASFLFFSEILTIVPIVAALLLYKKYYNISITLSMLMFYLLYFNTTFNAARQWLSISFAFLALAHLCTDRKRIVRSAVIAPFFHKSGLLGILLIGFYVFINRVRVRNVRIGALLLRKDKVKILEISIVSLILLFSMSAIMVPILSGIGLDKYIGYINGGVKFSVNQLIYQIPFMMILYFERKTLILDNNTKNDGRHRFELFSVCIFFVNAILSQLATVMEHSWRITLLFGLFNIILFPYLFVNEKSKTKRRVVLIILIAYLIFYWTFTYVIIGRHGTVPYVFSK